MCWCRLVTAGATGLACAWLAGCSAVVDVRPLATGRVDVAAYTLRGPDLAAVRREAERLCPQGGEVVFQASRGQRLVPADGRAARWLQQGTSWLEAASDQSQMTVVCGDLPGNRQLLATPAANPPTTVVNNSMPAPVGPLSIEW